ncbi:MAG: glycoside hydrolase family 16 protein [Cyclobacteriaceae bacterium]|nr:glycoside hydrolase family 16 protein [Cyclobacteriaceae bacterium]
MKALILVYTCLVLLAGCQESEEISVTGFIIESPFLEEGNILNTQTLQIKSKSNLKSDLVVSYYIKEGGARFEQDVKSQAGEITLSGQAGGQLDVEIVGDEFLEISETFDLIITYEGKEYPIPVTIQDDDEMEEILVSTTGYYTPISHPSMELVWSDEFSGAELNSNNWGFDLGNGCNSGVCGWGNNELETYTNLPANIRVENGTVKITALSSVGNYTSARIKTQEKVAVTYGRIDVRAKLPKGQGIWPAIWMLGENITSVGWPACGEIDIMELVGHQPQTTHGTVHYNKEGYKSSTGSSSLTTGNFSDQFHVFTLIWERDKMTWYVDNKSFKTFKPDVSAFTKPFFFILNVAVGGNWPGPPDDTTVFPQEMAVDYVRVFQ